MAREQNLGTSENWFIGADTVIAFQVYDEDEATILDTDGMAATFTLRKQGESDAIVFSKTTGAGDITMDGTWDADPDVNTQYVNVAIDAADTLNLQPGKYRFALKRTDSGNSRPWSYGDAVLKKV